jgi:hypothetical protein
MHSSSRTHFVPSMLSEKPALHVPAHEPWSRRAWMGLSRCSAHLYVPHIGVLALRYPKHTLLMLHNALVAQQYPGGQGIKI